MSNNLKQKLAEIKEMCEMWHRYDHLNATQIINGVPALLAVIERLIEQREYWAETNDYWSQQKIDKQNAAILEILERNK